MKILYVVHSFPPHNVAGTEIYTYNLCSELSKRHEIFVFHRVNDRGKEEYEVNYTGSGFHVYSINNTFRDCDSYEKIYKNEEIARRFGNLLDKIQPDVVHIQHLLFLSTTILDEVKSRNIPIVYTLNDYWLICPQAQFLRRNFQICNLDDELDCVDCQIFELNITENKKRIYSRLRKSYPSAARFLKKAYLYCVRPFSLLSKENKTKIRSRRDHIAFAIKRVDIFISPSKFLADKFIRLGLDPAKVIISAYGFNQEPFKNLKKKVNGGNITFGFIGTLLPHKGLDVLIKAFNEIENRNTELRIYGKVYPYAGYEYYPEHLKKLVKNKQIRFMGAFDNNRISEIFSEIDAIIVPSIWPENSPLVIQESFLAKTPVIAADIGGIPELVQHNKNGLLFRPNDAADLCRKIKFILAQPGSLSRLQRGASAVKSISEDAREKESLYLTLSCQG